MWGGIGGILKKLFGSELVEFQRPWFGQSWWNFEDVVWGRVGGIVKTLFGAESVEW